MQNLAMSRERSQQNKWIWYDRCSKMSTDLGSGAPGTHLEPDHASLLRITAGAPTGFGAGRGLCSSTLPVLPAARLCLK